MVREVPSFSAHPGQPVPGLWLNISVNSLGQWVPGMRMTGALCLVISSLNSASSAGWRGGETKLFASVPTGGLEHQLQRKA